ncbi:sensor histidine kinase [Streptomyces sp. 4N509B]
MSGLTLVHWNGPAVEFASAATLLVLCVALHLFHCNPFTVRQRDRYGIWTLILMTAVVYAPLPPMPGVLWGGLGGFLAGSILVVLRGSLIGWALYVINAAVIFGMALARLPAAEAVSASVGTLVAGLIVFGLTKLSDMAVQEQRSRDEAAWVAISKERLRFARDLHDLLGYSLSAITLKNELTYRLVGHNDDRAREELAETLRIARQALADVRAVVSGYRAMSLASELRSVIGVLHAAGVDVTVDGEADDLDARSSTMLAIVLREAVTNLLRHSSATRCRIVLSRHRGRVRLSVVNDGVSDDQISAVARRRGSGLDSLASRMASVRGTLTTVVDRGWFHLRAECQPDADAAPVATPMPVAEDALAPRSPSSSRASSSRASTSRASTSNASSSNAKAPASSPGPASGSSPESAAGTVPASAPAETPERTEPSKRTEASERAEKAGKAPAPVGFAPTTDRSAVRNATNTTELPRTRSLTNVADLAKATDLVKAADIAKVAGVTRASDAVETADAADLNPTNLLDDPCRPRDPYRVDPIPSAQLVDDGR